MRRNRHRQPQGQRHAVEAGDKATLYSYQKAIPNFAAKRHHIFFATTDTCGNISNDYDKLIKLVQDPELSVAREAASGLGKIGDEKARTPLLEALRKADPDSRQKFLEALRDGIRRRKATRADIMRYAKICRVQNVMRPYLETLG